jgi:hypothetical protein
MIICVTSGARDDLHQAPEVIWLATAQMSRPYLNGFANRGFTRMGLLQGSVHAHSKVQSRSVLANAT